MKRFIAIAVAGTLSSYAWSQGCSDAGFCTIGSLGHPAAETRPTSKQYLKLTLPGGIGDEQVFVFTPGIEYGFQKEKWLFSGRLTGNYASGDLAKAAAAGDAYLSATYSFPSEKNWQKSFTLGAKLPLNNGNLKEGGLSLPMQYQSSLGTVDAIVGLALRNERWNFAGGWQQPLSGINRNNFLPQYWPIRL